MSSATIISIEIVIEKVRNNKCILMYILCIKSNRLHSIQPKSNEKTGNSR